MLNEDVYLLRLRGDDEDRFVVAEAETYLSPDRDEMLRYSVTESKARALLKELHASDAEIETVISECLRRPYARQWESR